MGEVRGGGCGGSEGWRVGGKVKGGGCGGKMFL